MTELTPEQTAVLEISPLVRLLRFLQPGTRHSHDLSERPFGDDAWKPLCSLAIGLGFLRVADALSSELEVTDLGLAFLAALAAAERTAAAERERDEARDAADRKAKELLDVMYERDEALGNACVGRDKCSMCAEQFSEGNSYGRAHAEEDLDLWAIENWFNRQAMRDDTCLGDGYRRLYEEVKSLRIQGALSATNTLPNVLRERDEARAEAEALRVDAKRYMLSGGAVRCTCTYTAMMKIARREWTR